MNVLRAIIRLNPALARRNNNWYCYYHNVYGDIFGLWWITSSLHSIGYPFIVIEINKDLAAAP